MRKLLIVIIFVSEIITAKGQCTSNYSYSGTTDTLAFTNLSTFSNAHYYWHFGDGSGSNAMNPVHIFPDDGDYLVTLYGLDTISNCSNAYETWIHITKPDTMTCNVVFDAYASWDEIITNNLSTNCSNYSFNCITGPGTYCGIMYLGNPVGTVQLWIARLQAYTFDSIYNYRLWKEYFVTVPNLFSSSINYQNCSSNFEIITSYQPNGALVTFTSMNKAGTDTFGISGFGNGIYLAGPTASYLFPYSGGKSYTRTISHQKFDLLHGCSPIVCVQDILIKNPYWHFPPNCVIYSQPQTQTVIMGTTVKFIIESPDDVSKQWQEDAGAGFVDLINSSTYYGVTTDTLKVVNVQSSMNNYQYRCIVADASGFGCYNISSVAVLYVNPTGINETELQNIKIYSNPANEYLIINNQFIENSNLSITDFSGRIMYQAGFRTPNFKLETLTYPNGIYFLQLKTKEGILNKKFVVQH